MKNFKQLIFAIAVVVGFSITASAQQNDGKKIPPKDKPPVIIPKDKPKEDKPRDDRNKDNKGKKPELFFMNL